MRAVPMATGDRRKAGLRLGIGDDAALLSPRAGSDLVVSSDFFLQDRHFLLRFHPADSVGYKSLARAASDLAAMGAEPAAFLLNLALPADKTGAWLNSFLAGLARASREIGILLIGGDLAKYRTVAISITVMGYVSSGRAARRSGARPGDLIYISGKLGAARLGLELIRKRADRKRGAQRLLQPHLYPSARTELGAWLARRRLVTSMMDISDGLSIDLNRLCQASRVGAIVEAARIPRVRIPGPWAKLLRLRASAPVDFALNGGDDYELLFTVPPRRARELRRAPGGVPLTCIGKITRARHLDVVDSLGRKSPLAPGGWDHFRD